MAEIMGKYHKVKMVCDFCHRAKQGIYLVSEGECRGKFCSALHFQLAREKKKQIEQQISATA